MTRKEQNKILDAKIESNVNQYKVDGLNAKISAFSSGDLNKYEFLKRIDLNYKPNALDKARFEFSPLGRAFNEGLDKTIPNSQEEGVIKLLKEIRDNLPGLAMPADPPSSPSLPPSSPGSPCSPGSSSLINVTPLPPPSSPGSSSLTNVTPLFAPGPSKKTRAVRSRPKLLQTNSQKFLDQLKLEASQRPRPKISPVIPIMSTPKRYQSDDLDDALKELDKQYKKYNLDNASKEINERIKLLKEEEKQRHERIKLLKEQEQEQKQEKLEKQKDELNKLLENMKNK